MSKKVNGSKKTRRNQNKFPALKPNLNLKSRVELIDYDYIDKLSDKEKSWLNRFTEEYINADLDTKNLKKNLHNTKELKKDCQDRNNARNRDILTREKARGFVVYLEEVVESDLKKDTINMEEDYTNEESEALE